VLTIRSSFSPLCVQPLNSSVRQHKNRLSFNARHKCTHFIDKETIGKMRSIGGALLFARYAGDDMSDGPMMRTPILIISSRRAFS
jgi:hypothetical protein